MSKEEISKRLKQARIAAGYNTAQSFIKQFGFSQARYSLHETGKRSITISSAIEYAECLGISLNWLLTGKEGGSDSQTKSSFHDSDNFDKSDLLSSTALIDLKTESQKLDIGGGRISDTQLQDMTLVSETKHGDLVEKSVDQDLLMKVVSRVVALYYTDSSAIARDIATAITFVYNSIESLSSDKAGKNMLIEPLIEALKMGIERDQKCSSLQSVNQPP